jgi:hypothetical protein
MDKKTKACFLSGTVLFICLFLCSGLSAQEEFKGRLFPDAARGSQRALNIIISIDEYTSKQEVFQLIQIYHQSGYKQFRDDLREMKKGILRPVGGTGNQVVFHLAQYAPKGTGGEIILVGESQSWNLDSRRRHDNRFPYLVVELSFDEKGKGSGNIYLQADIRLTSHGIVEIASYNQPPRQILGLELVK